MRPETEQAPAKGVFARAARSAMAPLRGFRHSLPKPLLALAATLLLAAIGVQAWTAVMLSRSAVEESSSAANRRIAASFAEQLAPTSKQSGDLEIGAALDELSRLNPNVRPYVVNEHGIVVFSPSALGNPQQPFVSRRQLADALAHPESRDISGDDPHNLGASAAISAAPVLVRGARHFVYVVLAPASSARSGLSAALGTWGWAILGAIITTGLIVALLLFMGHRRVKSLQSSVAALSHDLRAPLSSIQGYLETAIKRSDSLGQNDSKRFMSVALRSTQSATNMVNDLHHLSTIEAAGHEVEMERLSIVDLVMDSVVAVRPAANEKRILLGWSIPPAVPLVLGNAALLERLARNLLENAIRYTPPGGSVEVVFEVLADSVKVTVLDSGVGIPSAELGKVSRSFFRGSNAKAASKGSGIGLAVCSSIAKLHGAELQILSREREGTAVAFEISQAEQRYT